MAIMVHFKFHGEPLCILLDAVEVARSHMGLALVEEFAQILKQFGIDHKVSRISIQITGDSPIHSCWM
jgi:hypothetical protein